jgi:regulator of sigma E protease
VEPDSPAASAGLVPGDRVLAIDGSPVDTWMELYKEITFSPDQRKRLEVERGGGRLQVEIALGSRSRYKLGYAGILPHLGVVVREVTPGMPAARAGLEPGDEILEVDGQPVANSAEAKDRLASRPGESVRLTLLRAGERLERQVEVAGTAEGGRIGVALDVPTRIQRYPPLRALAQSLSKAREDSGLMFVTLRKLLRGELSMRAMSGPIDIYKFTGSAWQQGIITYFGLMAAISLQLGLINLFPIPVLDGGHILVLAIEGVLRRDLGLKVKERVMQVGFVFLVLVMGMVIYFDVVKNFF